MLRNLVRTISRSTHFPDTIFARAFIGMRQNSYFFISPVRHSTFEQISSGVNATNIDSILSDLQALSYYEQATALEMIINTTQGQQVLVAVILHERFVAMSQKYPSILIEGRMLLMSILSKQLSSLMLEKKPSVDELNHCLSTIQKSYEMCYEQLEKITKQRWREHKMVNNKISDYFIIHLSKYVSKHRKQPSLRLCTGFYQKSNQNMKILFKDLTNRVESEKKAKDRVMQEILIKVEFYAFNVLNLNQITKDLYELNHDQEELTKQMLENSKQISNVLQIYKIVWHLSPLSMVHCQLKKTKLTADYYLSHQKLVQTKASEEEMEKLKKKVAIDLGKLHDEIMTRYEQTCLEGKNIQRMWDTALTLMTVKTDQLEKEGLSLDQFKEALKQEQQAIASKIADKDILNMVAEKLEANVEYIMKLQQWRTEQISPQERKDML